MSILALDHVNVRSRDPKATLAFFRDVLLMKVAGPMGGAPREDGGWVYDDNDLPIVHIGSANERYPMDERIAFTPAEGSGAIHHVALRCSDFDGTKARLQSLGIGFTENDVPQVSLHQLFVSDPNGITLELNFKS